MTIMDAAWNANSTLTDKLGGKAWAANNAGRGYKVIRLYRTKCGESSKVELDIVDKGGKAHCDYGGAVKHAKLDPSVDYVWTPRSTTSGPLGRLRHERHGRGLGLYGQGELRVRCHGGNDHREAQVQGAQDGGHEGHGALQQLPSSDG
jgi:hypothetical protein